jgi:hypothetical protein
MSDEKGIGMDETTKLRMAIASLELELLGLFPGVVGVTKVTV